MNPNRYFVFFLPDMAPFYIRCYGSKKIVVQHHDQIISISDSHGFSFSKPSFMSIISHCFDLPYIKRYEKKCILAEISQDDFKGVCQNG